MAEQLIACCSAIADLLPGEEELPVNSKGSKPPLPHRQLSVFRSAPDTWAIDQLFR